MKFSVKNNFQILPVENNWENGVRKEFKPFSSEMVASQVSRNALDSLAPLTPTHTVCLFFVGWKCNKHQRHCIFQESVDEVEKEDKKKVVVSGAATGEEDAFPKVVSNSDNGNWVIC